VMDKNLWNVLLLTTGGVVLGYTLFQVVARRISGKRAGAAVLTAVGCVMIGFTQLPGVGSVSAPGLAGAVCIISGALLTATTVRRGAPGLPPSETGRIEGPHGVRQTPGG
jgi:hypothetical protein